jgi:hypothetical protein
MDSIFVHQALLAVSSSGDPRWLGQSAELPEKLRAFIEQICRSFGGRPAELLEEALFAQPLDREWIVVGRVRGLGGDEQHPPEIAGFHLLILHADQYWATTGDPFAVAATPVNWEQRGTLPMVTVPVPPALRTTEQVRSVIRGPDGLMLLGAAQALVDGGRVAFVRPRPDPQLLQHLWMLLPIRARCQLWPATYVYHASGTFHVLAAPADVARALPPSYLSEEQAANYPEGRYELAVHGAAETGDQVGLNALFARRSAAEVWRLGLWVAGGLIVLTLAMNLVKGCGG